MPAASDDGPLAASIQLVEGVSAEALVPFDQLEEASHVQRLAADRDLVARLARQGFRGPEWDLFADVLARYGYQVIRVWILTMKIFPQLRAKGLGGLRPPTDGRRWTSEEADELALETVGTAIAKFRQNVLLADRWMPERGASLKTFFIGQCLIRFANVYRRWLHETEPSPWAGEPILALDDDDQPRETAEHGDPAAVVISHLETVRHLAQAADPRTRFVLEQVMNGYSHAEVAGLLGITAKAVEGILYRHRRRLKAGV
jgi:DNA-directed RNA polymerase specialized sigma24 family protein